MKKPLYIIAMIAFYLGAVLFFTAGNNVAGILNLFSGTCFLIACCRNIKTKE